MWLPSFSEVGGRAQQPPERASPAGADRPACDGDPVWPLPSERVSVPRRSLAMKRISLALLSLALLLFPAVAQAETTLEKIARTGVLTIGTRTAVPPFAFMNKQGEWVGFAIDLVEQAI